MLAVDSEETERVTSDPFNCDVTVACWWNSYVAKPVFSMKLFCT